jgi:hypothetical protein
MVIPASSTAVRTAEIAWMRSKLDTADSGRGASA